MSWRVKFQKAWKSFNAESTEEVYNIIKKKYFYLFQIAAMYPKLEGFWMYFGLLQLSTYIFLIAYHWVFILISIPKMAVINFVLFSQSIHYLVLATLTMVVLLYVFFRRYRVARFHKVIHGGVYNYMEDDGEIFTLFNDEINREWQKLLFVPAFVAITAGIGLVISPILDKYGTFRPEEANDPSISFNVPVPMWYPFDTDPPWIRFILTVCQLCAGGIVGLAIASGGLGYICLAQTVTREFRILLHAVETVEERSNSLHLKKYGSKPSGSDYGKYQSPTFFICLNTCYKKLYEHHLAILSLADDMSAILGFPNIIAFGGGPLIIGMALLSTTISGGQLPGTTITALVLCVIEITYMYLFSALGQRVTDLSADFRTKLYNIKWYYCRKSILMKYSILQVATKTPYTLYAPFKFMPSNLETFGSVMNSAYSLYNLMLAMN